MFSILILDKCLTTCSKQRVYLKNRSSKSLYSPHLNYCRILDISVLYSGYLSVDYIYFSMNMFSCKIGDKCSPALHFLFLSCCLALSYRIAAQVGSYIVSEEVQMRLDNNISWCIALPEQIYLKAFLSHTWRTMQWTTYSCQAWATFYMVKLLPFACRWANRCL